MQGNTPLSDDDDLANRARRDGFWIRRILKFTVLGCAVVLIVAFTILLGCKLGFDEAFRNSMTNIMKDNIVSIIFGVSAILGVNLRDIKFTR